MEYKIKIKNKSNKKEVWTFLNSELPGVRSKEIVFIFENFYKVLKEDEMDEYIMIKDVKCINKLLKQMITLEDIKVIDSLSKNIKKYLPITLYTVDVLLDGLKR